MLKNKIKYYFIVICLLTFIFAYSISIISSASTTGTVYLSANKITIEKGDEIEITINIEDSKTAAYSANLYFDNTKMEYVSGPENTNVLSNRIIVVWYDSQGGTNSKEGELSKFVFRAKSDGIANFIIDGDFYNEKGQLIQTSFEEEQIQVGKEKSKLEKETENEQGTNTQVNNASLQVLRINQEGIVPSFDSNVYNYYLTVSNDIKDIEVLAIAENPNATIDVNGNTGLKDGLNIIKIQVTSEDKTKNQLYTIEVTKTADAEAANANLEILAIENAWLDTPFDNNTVYYKTEVSNKIENLNVFAVPENENGTVLIEGKDNIKEGNNLIKVTVTAPNGFTKKVFEVEVYKRNQEEEQKYEEEQSSNQEKLNEAYEVENVSAVEEIKSVNEDQKKNFIVGFVFVIGLIIAIIVVITSILNKEK